MQGPDRPIPIRPGRLTHWPEGHERQHLERQVRHFTKCRVRLDSDFCVATFDQGNPDQKRRDRKAIFMAKLQAELLHHENWAMYEDSLMRHCHLFLKRTKAWHKTRQW